MTKLKKGITNYVVACEWQAEFNEDITLLLYIPCRHRVWQ